MGSAEGSRKAAARRIGVTVDFYEAMVSAGLKWCTACKQWHEHGAFGRDTTRSDGLSARCLASRVMTDAKPSRHQRRLALSNGLRWCRDCACWLPAETVRQGRCRKHINEKARELYARNAAAVCLRKRARKRGLAPVPLWWREEAFKSFGGLCAYGCDREAVALDHITPVRLGGLSEPSNLAPVCVTCNSKKGARDPLPWVERGIAAFPDQWTDLFALALEVGRSTDWVA